MTSPEPAALLARAAALRARGATPAYYIYWFPASASGTARTAPARPRTLLAFPSPDAALAFAQHAVQRDPNTPPRLRRLALPQLLEAVLREPAISALLLVAEDAPLPAAGALPEGMTVAREELIGE